MACDSKTLPRTRLRLPKAAIEVGRLRLGRRPPNELPGGRIFSRLLGLAISYDDARITHAGFRFGADSHCDSEKR